MHPSRSILSLLTAALLAGGAVPRAGAETCADNEFEAKKIIFRSEKLPIEMSGFFPYVIDGNSSAPAKKYATESWSGTGMAIAPGCGCFVSYSDIAWSGNWTFSTSNFTDASSKAGSYLKSACGGGSPAPVVEENLKHGLGASGVLSPFPSSQTPLSRRAYYPDAPSYSSCIGGIIHGYTDVTEELGSEFTIQAAKARAENFITIVENSGNLQYWSNNAPGTEAEIQAGYTSGQLTRTSAIKAPAERISFEAHFCVPCMGEGTYQITYYYKKWAIGETEPGKYETVTEEVQFKEAPYVIDQQPYHHELKQGEQCKLVKVTARKVEDCARREAGASSARNQSVDMHFFLGKRANGNGVGSLAVTGTSVAETLYSPSSLQLLAVEDPELLAVKLGGALRQIKAPEVFVDVVTLPPQSYELRYYLDSQVGALDSGTGLYALTGQPFVTYLVENPDSGTATNRIRFTETRGSTTKVTLYAYDAATNTMAMTSGNGLRTEELKKEPSGQSVIETRTIKDALGQVVSVVRETKQLFPFGPNVTQRLIDPAGAALGTTYTYYTDAAADGGAYGQVKLEVQASGRWTSYTYDAQGRPATTVTQFLNTAANSAANLNRVASVTYGTIPDQDGDSITEKLVTTIQSLLGQEIGRSYDVTFSLLGTASGQPVETRWDIQCTVSGAAWDATSNLFTKRRFIASGSWLGRPISELRPDGTLTTYGYMADSSNLTTTTYTGAADGTGTAVASGTRTVLVETAFRQMISREVFDYPSNTLLTSELVTDTDNLGRPTRIEFIDGTEELRSYACCGLDMVTDRQGITTNYRYNALGQVDRETRAGLKQDRTLDPLGRVVATKRVGTDNSEITTSTHQYDVAGRLVWSKDALNRQTSFAETVNGTVRATTTPDGGGIVSTYNKDGSLLNVTGTAAAQKLTYEYGVDADGVFTKEIRVGNSGETTEWVKTYTDFAGRPYKRVYADNAVERSYYNEAGQLVRQVDADNLATLFAYNAKGEQEVTALDLNGNEVIDYTGADRITRTQTEVGTRDTYTVQRSTTAVWETEGSDAATVVSVGEATLDGLRSWQTDRGQLTSSVTTLAGSGSRTVTTTGPDGTVAEQTYLNDRLQSVTTSRSSLGTLNSVGYAYDAHGRLETATDARTGATSYTYFNDDQINTVTTPDPDSGQSGPGYDAQSTVYGYDSAGRQSTVTQPDGGVVTTEYHPTGQVKKVTGARTYPVEYTYDTQGRLKTLKTWQNYAGNSGTATTTWNYTPTRGFLLNKRYADNTGPGYTYKSSGRLLTRTWARGITTTYGYGPGGDPTGVDYSDTTPDVTIAYDRSGRPKTRSDAAGLCTWTYHSSGQLDSETYTGSLLDGLSLDRDFDSLARLSSLSASSALSAVNQIGYSYDAASRLETVTSGTNTATYTYVPNSPLIGSVTFKQGGTTRLTTTKTYDNLNRLGSIVNTPSSALPAPSYSYTYNAANQRTKATREDTRYWDYGYDFFGQVKSATKKLAGSATVLGHEYGYIFDDIGNRDTATINGRLFNYTANSLNQYSSVIVPATVDVLGTAVTDANITVNGQAVSRQGEAWHLGVTAENATAGDWINLSVAGVRPGAGPGGADAVSTSMRKAWVPKTPESFSHDADGNLVLDGRWAYTWDGENRLIAMETRSDILPPAGQFPLSERRKLEFAYDGQGRRVSKKVSNWSPGGWVLASSTLFLYDGWNMIAELNALSANSAVRTYVWGLDLSGSIQGAGGVGGLIFSTFSSQLSTYAPAFDGNGNVIAYVDMATGAKSASYEYSAFGETLMAEGVAHEQMPFRFSNKFTDNETSLLYYGLRYYNSSTGRWIGRDPALEVGGLNMYALLANDPIGDIDFLGLWSGSGIKDALEKCACKAGPSSRAARVLNYNVLHRASVYSYSSIELHLDYDESKIDSKSGAIVWTKKRDAIAPSSIYSPGYYGTVSKGRVYLNAGIPSDEDAAATLYHEYLHTQGEEEPSAHFNEEIMRKECGWKLHYDGSYPGQPNFWQKGPQGDFLDFDGLSTYLTGSSTGASGGTYTKLANAIDQWIASLTSDTAKRHYTNVGKRRVFVNETNISFP